MEDKKIIEELLDVWNALEEGFMNIKKIQTRLDKLEKVNEMEQKPQDKAIETLKIKGSLEPLVDKYGFYRIQEVLASMSG